jgi:hypothetical protein
LWYEKKYIIIIKVVLVILVISVISILVINNRNLRESVSIYDNNFKALNLKRDSVSKAVIAYRFSLEQLYNGYLVHKQSHKTMLSNSLVV